MSAQNSAPAWIAANLIDIEAVPCPCGMTRRAFTEDSDRIASVHMVDITADAKTHYHKNMTEIYYILEGVGRMRIGNEQQDVGPGDAIAIPPGEVHQITNTGEAALIFLCCCAPGYEHEDTVLQP